MKTRYWTAVAMGTTTIASSWLASHQAGATSQSNDGDSSKNNRVESGVKTNAVGSLCSPIVGTGKSTGVPIAVENASGQLRTDVSGLTFELDNGAGTTQDVTEYITTAAEQPLVTGQAPNGAPVQAYPHVEHLFSEIPGASPATDVIRNYSNPGYYFLACTPDATRTSVKFPAGTVLKAIRNGVVVASGSVEGRSAAALDLGDDNNSAPSSTIRPGAGDHETIETVYEEYLKLVPVHFNQTFAQLAILQLSNDLDNSVYCYEDLIIKSTTWNWTPRGLEFIAELTNTSFTASAQWPMLVNRTNAISNDLYSDPAVRDACDNLNLNDLEDDRFVNYLAAQLLLIDAPAGRVPAGISGASVDTMNGVSDTFLKPAVRLVSTGQEPPEENNSNNNVVNNTTTVAPTTTQANTQKASRLPSTGSDSIPTGLIALGAIMFGSFAIVATRRRVITK